MNEATLYTKRLLLSRESVTVIKLQQRVAFLGEGHVLCLIALILPCAALRRGVQRGSCFMPVQN